MPHVSQGGPSPGIGTQFEMPYLGSHDVDSWISEVSLPMGSPSNRTTVSDYHDLPSSVDMSISLSGTTFQSSGHSTGSDHNSPSDTTVCQNSPQHETDYHTYSKYQNEEITVGHTSRRNQSNVVSRSNHGLPMTTSSSLNGLGEEHLFNSPVEMHNQPYFQNNVTIATNGIHMGHPGLTPSELWDADQESRVPSPVFNNGVWSATFVDSPPESHQEFSLDCLDLSTQYARIQEKSMDQSLNRNPGDHDAYGPYSADEFSFDMYPDEHYSMDESQNRRASADAESSGAAREHPLYQKATTSSDGLYHCPWEGKDPSCNHKPEKLKCNYDKFVDSHLKPYRCKVHTCENARFSSTACLLRHEREAHFMHGHGEKPFRCSFSGCERGLPGHGFPRHWNLRDHMRRVHNREPSPSSSNKPAKVSRKRKTDALEGGSNKRTPNTTSTAEPPQVVRLSPKEQLQFRNRQVRAQLQQLDDADPDDPATREKLRNAENTIKEMHHLVHAAPKVSRRSSQISG